MNFTSQYNRGNLSVVHPQLEQSVNDQRVGRKRFDTRKNEESSGLSYGYGLNSGNNRPAPQNVYSKYQAGPYKAESAPEPYYKPMAKQDYKSEPGYKEPAYNFGAKQAGDVGKYNEERSGMGKGQYDEPRGYEPQADGKYAQSYEEPKYEDQYYKNPGGKEQGYPDPYAKVSENPYQKYPENSYQKYPENPYQKYPENSYQKYPENSYQKYPENPSAKYSEIPNPKYPENPAAKYPENPAAKYPENPAIRYPENPYLKYQENPNLKQVENPYQKYQEPPNQKYPEAPQENYPDTYENYGEKDYEQMKANEYQESPQEENRAGDNKYEDPKPSQYSDEIEKLKEELRRKEEELNIYQQGLSKNQPPLKEDDQHGMYSRINKAMFDKQRIEDQKLINSSSLEYQITQKSRLKMMQQLEKEKEQAIRLEMLKKLREDEARERYERLMRAKEYREQLEVQSLVKSNITQQEKIFYKNDVPRLNESPPPRPVESLPRSNNSVQSISYSPAAPKFTKKTPKTMCYNPITGVLKDTTQYVIGSYPGYNIKDPSITYLKNQSNIPELAAHPAFHQQKFTKNHPKLVHSFPITGGPISEVKEPQEPEYKQSDKHMAEYGSLVMQNKNPTYN